MARARIPAADGDAAVIAVRAGSADRPDTALAVRYLLQVLAERSPGNSVEVRVPPYGAAQCIEGPRHTRGTPPNVVEMQAATWVALAAGDESWAQAIDSGAVRASGSRADLTGYVPLWRAPVVR